MVEILINYAAPEGWDDPEMLKNDENVKALNCQLYYAAV